MSRWAGTFWGTPRTAVDYCGKAGELGSRVASRAKDPLAYTHHGGAFGNRKLVVPAHAHGQVLEAFRGPGSAQLQPISYQLLRNDRYTHSTGRNTVR